MPELAMNGVDRRTFIVGAAGLTGAAAVAASGGGFSLIRALAGLFGPSVLAAEELTHELLATLTGRELQVEAGAGAPVTLKVTKVTPVETYSEAGTGPHGVLPAKGDLFAVLLQGPAGQALDQNTYQLRSDDVGIFPLFLVPVGPRTGGRLTYQAVFNRLRLPASR